MSGLSEFFTLFAMSFLVILYWEMIKKNFGLLASSYR